MTILRYTRRFCYHAAIYQRVLGCCNVKIIMQLLVMTYTFNMHGVQARYAVWQHAVKISNSNHWVGFLNESLDDVALSLNFYPICAIRKRFLTSMKVVSCTSTITFHKLPPPALPGVLMTACSIELSKSRTHTLMT